VIIGIGLSARAHAVTLRGRIAAGAPCSLYSESAGREGRLRAVPDRRPLVDHGPAAIEEATVCYGSPETVASNGFLAALPNRGPVSQPLTVTGIGN
jgi:hypothetical protein